MSFDIAPAITPSGERQGILTENLLSWKHSGFSIDNSVKIFDDQTRENLGEYMARPPRTHARAVSEANDQPLSLKKIRHEPFKQGDSPKVISQARGFARSAKRRGEGAFSYHLFRVFQAECENVRCLGFHR